MANIIIRPGWYLPDRQATPESAFLSRRGFLGAAALAGMGLAAPGCRESETAAGVVSATQPATTAPAGLYPAPRNRRFTLEGPLTDERVAATHNNFYEFTTNKARVWQLVGDFKVQPWQIEITGDAEVTGIFDVDALIRRVPLEERLYRFRCVEAWAMDVPWTGLPLGKLIEQVRPASDAKYVAFTSFHRPEEAPGQRDPGNRYLQWPYVEGLTLAEATNELTLLSTGIYGRPLPKQHGAPIRLIVPWKYGFKSIKSIVKIAFVRERPPTTWSRAVPQEYTFDANVEPHVPHPRWSQASERMIGTGERRKTLLYNGYADQVAHLYRG